MLKELINKLLEEVDPDIKEIMLKKEMISSGTEFAHWELLNSPALTIIEWQRLRNE